MYQLSTQLREWTFPSLDVTLFLREEANRRSIERVLDIVGDSLHVNSQGNDGESIQKSSTVGASKAGAMTVERDTEGRQAWMIRSTKRCDVRRFSSLHKADATTTTVVFLRHGQSVWNKENKYTGWVDVPLSDQGVMEAQTAGKLLKKGNFMFDMCYTSYLRRAIKTCNLALEELEQEWIPVSRDYRLNERHYGALSGLNKAETTEKFGKEQVFLWRRSYDTKPPPVDKTSQYWPGHEKRYMHIPSHVLPSSESLKCTVARASIWWMDMVVPLIKDQPKQILVVAHGNSIRALVKMIDNLSDKTIAEVNIPTGVPLVYKFACDSGHALNANRDPVLSGYYLLSDSAMKQRQDEVARQADAVDKK